MTVLYCAVFGAAAFVLGVTVGYRYSAEKPSKAPPLCPKPKVEPIADETRNFLNYDGTQQR